MRPMATVTHDTLDWYGWDDDGAGIHDVIGTRCDPYTKFTLAKESYHFFLPFKSHARARFGDGDDVGRCRALCA